MVADTSQLACRMYVLIAICLRYVFLVATHYFACQALLALFINVLERELILAIFLEVTKVINIIF